jgi:hypothetical protein
MSIERPPTAPYQKPGWEAILPPSEEFSMIMFFKWSTLGILAEDIRHG